MTLAFLVARYSAFAAIATAVNLATQHACLTLATGLPAAMAAGTVAGVAVKYTLDKRWIFYDATTGAAANSRKLALYSTVSVFTTLLFWATELIFMALFAAPLLGAAIGLSLGYAAKYRLDRRYVFKTGPPRRSSP
jgi:putative flippase GtrA